MTVAGCSRVVDGTGGPHFHSCDGLLVTSAIPVPKDLRGRLVYGCATVQVPLDYSRPGGTQISLQLFEVHDVEGTHKIGSLLVNPGGPGASGVELAAGLVGQISPAILQRFDLVGFDPRGVEFSSPIDCTTDAQKDRLNAMSPDVLTPAGFAQAKRAATSVAHACEHRYGAALAQYDTENTARDMDRIRQYLGDPQLNYLGFSYGTELGAAYAHLFPGRIRVAVLDGAVDPLTSGISQFAAQLRGFELAFDQFADWCTVQPTCASLGDPRTDVYRIVAAANAHPLASGSSTDPRVVTSSLVLTGVLEALYSKSDWPKLAAGLQQAGHGDGAGLLALADQYNQRYGGHYTNLSDANLTISCNDQRPGPSDALIRRTAKVWAKRYPMFGLWSAASLFACQQWQPHRTPEPLPTAPTNNTVLVLGNLHDPATPYQGAIDLTKTLGNARLLTWNGEGHTSYLEGSGCVNRYVNAYLIHQTLPAANTTCPR